MNPDIKARYEARKPKIEKVLGLPASEGDWYVRELQAADDIKFNREYDAHEKAGHQFAWFACVGACDEAGKRLFVDEDLPWIVEHIPALVLRVVWRQGGKLNGYTKAEAEDVEKNSEPIPSGSSF